MEYAAKGRSAVFDRISALPDEYFSRLTDYLDFLSYEIGRKSEEKAAVARFNRECAKAQAWAKEVGLTEQDIADTLKEIRLEKRRAAQ